MRKTFDKDQDTSYCESEHHHAVFKDKNFGRVDIMSYNKTKMDIVTEIGTIRFLDGETWFEARSASKNSR
jgi:hypothetical protein